MSIRKLKIYRNISVFLIFSGLIFYGSVAFIGYNNLSQKIYKEDKYQEAVRLFEKADADIDDELLEKSYEIFDSIEDYKDASKYIDKYAILKRSINIYYSAKKLMNGGFDDKIKAAEMFYSIRNYWDSYEQEELIYKNIIIESQKLRENSDYDAAENKLKKIPNYSKYHSEAYKMLEDIENEREIAQMKEKYKIAINHFNEGLYDIAQIEFVNLQDYEESKNYLNTIGEKYLKEAEEKLEAKDYYACLECLGRIMTEKEYPVGYERAIQLKNKVYEEYSIYVENTASSLIATKGYDAMVEFMGSVDNKLYSRERVEQVLEKYKPLPLTSINYYDSSKFNYVIDNYDDSNSELEACDELIDEYGDTHTNCLSGGGRALKYHLGKKYHYLSGSVFVLQNEKATEQFPVYFEVDDINGNVLYSVVHKSGFPNESFSIDVSQVDDVIIKFDAERFEESGLFFVDRYIFGGLEIYLIP